MDCSKPGLPFHHQLPEFTQTHVYWVSDAIRPSHPPSSSSPPTFNISQHQGLFQWVSSSRQVAQVLEFQFQHQSFQWIFRTDFPTGKTVALTRWTLVGKVMSLLFNMLSRLIIIFLPRNKHLLIPWLQSPSAVILEPPKLKSVTVFTISLFAMRWWDQTPWS